MIGLRNVNNSTLSTVFSSEIRCAILNCVKNGRCGSLSLQHSRTMTRELRPPKRPLYLDAQATTPMDPRVLDAMLPYMNCYHGNPHSRTHFYGWEAEAGVEKARRQVADLIKCDPKEIVFTSGATESNNIAIKGVARFYKSKKKHVITTQTEHKCVLDSCRALEAEGFDITYLPVGPNGVISLADLEAAIRTDTVLVSVMSVNNEIGVRQPIKEIVFPDGEGGEEAPRREDVPHKGPGHTSVFEQTLGRWPDQPGGQGGWQRHRVSENLPLGHECPFKSVEGRPSGLGFTSQN